MQSQNRMDQLLDFQSAMSFDMEVVDDPRERLFYEKREKKEFLQSGLGDVVENVVANNMRLTAHARLILSVFNYGRRYQEVFSKHWDPRSADADYQLTIADTERKVMKWIMGQESFESYIGFRTSHLQVAGFAVAPTISDRVDIERHTQIRSFYSSLLIEAWSLFEVLCEDLWEAALNSHPTQLAELKGHLRGQAKANRDAQQSIGGPTISFNQLQINEFDVRSRMGTILKQQKTISFRSLSAIREAYQRAFADSKSIEKTLDDPLLRAAAAVRNLLVHKRGKIDAEFKKQMGEELEGSVFTTEIGDTYDLTGKICAKLCYVCQSRALWLVNAVHAWIIANPESPPKDA